MAIDETMRKMMGKQAVQLAKKVGYWSAGTVEFLVDKHRQFYFLEMNTRLQVEHPITEYITGIDLVEQMIRVAAGQRLSLQQSDIKINGWALESRVYAEDPKLFLPSIGRLQKYQEPLESGNPSIRCDSGIREGSEISIYYDPLICKLCTHGPDRMTALNRMNLALDSYVIRGVTHNIPLIREVLSQHRFQKANITTNYLQDEFPTGFPGHQVTSKELSQLVAAAAHVYQRQSNQIGGPSVERQGVPNALYITVEGVNVEAVIEALPENHFRVMLGEETYNLALASDWHNSASLIRLTIDNEPHVMQYHGSSYLGDLKLQSWGTIYHLCIRTEVERELFKHMPIRRQADSERIIKAPMAGQIVSLAVSEGETVREGAEIAVIEAMKMQNVLRASKAGKIKAISIKAGQNVAPDQSLVEMEFL